MTINLAEKEAEAIAAGFELVQSGRVIEAPRQGLSFAERVEGFNIHALGYTGQHTRYVNLLLEDGERWVHLRRDKDTA